MRGCLLMDNTNNLKRKKMIYILLIHLLLIAQVVKANEVNPINTIELETEYINAKKWSLYGELWSKESNDIISFLKEDKNKINHVGVFNIKEGKLLSIKHLPTKVTVSYIPEIVRYENKYEISTFYVETKYKVKKEDKYHLNGSNFFIFILVFEDKEWKILFKAIADTNRILADGWGFGISEEKTFYQRRMKYLK